MADTVIAGIGNLYRGDDAAGWILIDRIKEQLEQTEIHCIKQGGDAAQLIDLFSTYKSVYIVDAGLMNAPAGTWRRIDAIQHHLGPDDSQTSTHGFGLGQAVELARNLGQLPEKLVVYVISGTSFHMKEGLSESVDDSLRLVIEAILKEKDIQRCMKKG